MTFTWVQEGIRQFLGLDKARRVGRAVRRVRPRLEVLEDRLAPAAFLVTKTVDDGTAGTFRWAIQQANADTDPSSTIKFQIGAAGSTAVITLDPTFTVRVNGSHLGRPRLD